MAGDWIKFELTTMDKPEVCQIADLADIDPDAVIGKLMRVWGWFDQQTENGNAPSVSKKLLDRAVGVTGFCDFMKSVNWMVESEGVISLPHFDRHNGKTAKNRLLTAKRVANHKAGNAKGNAPIVSDALPKEDVDVEKNKDLKQEPPLPPEGGCPAEAALELALETASEPVRPKPKARSAAKPKFDPNTACPANVSPDLWAKWVQFRRELGKSLKQTTCEAQAAQLEGHCNPDEVVRRSIAAGWQGLFPDSVTAVGNVHHLPSRTAIAISPVHNGFGERNYNDGLIAREDGTYGF